MADVTSLDELHAHLKHVLPLLEESYKNQPTPMLEMIVTRYQSAIVTIESYKPEDLTKDMFNIRGGVRAYLEVASDYMNPMLEEMNKAEKLLEEVFS